MTDGQLIILIMMMVFSVSLLVEWNHCKRVQKKRKMAERAARRELLLRQNGNECHPRRMPAPTIAVYDGRRVA